MKYGLEHTNKSGGEESVFVASPSREVFTASVVLAELPLEQVSVTITVDTLSDLSIGDWSWSKGMQNPGISAGGVTGIGMFIVNSNAVIANVKAILSHV